MTGQQHDAIGASRTAPAAVRTITEIGPFTGATSFAVGPGLVFASADGTWGRIAS